MRLVELEPQFLRWSADCWPDAEGERTLKHVSTLAEANGIVFLCPVCLLNNGMSDIGVHSVECFDPAVPLDGILPGPGRWSMSGTGFEDLTLTASSSSIKLNGGCNGHFFITNGAIIIT